MNTSLATAYWPRLNDSLLLKAVIVLAGTALLTVSAKVQVPFWPVPMTMQTFAVLFIGAALGSRLGGATVLAYLAQGAVGLPVFATGAGVAYMAGPTGGYLLGFLVAAVAVGYLANRDNDHGVVRTLFAFAIGEVLIFALGAAWLASFIGVEKAIAAGVTPFLLAEGLKIALACAALPFAWKFVSRKGAKA